jgi:transcriptional regulator with XRE-family HTH domain
MLGDLIRRERERRGLSIRGAARLIGISAGYLVEIEHGRNPSTGRAPVPSPTVLRGMERALEIDIATLLDLAGAASSPSSHALLVQAGAQRRSRTTAARAAGTSVDAWIEVAGPHTPAEAIRLAALRAGAAGEGRFGVIFDGRGAGLRTGPEAILAAERAWEEDVATACRAAAGVEPAANVCVYRDADLREAAGADPIEIAIGLVRAHPHVAAQDPRGRLTTGPAAIEAILAAVRPPGIADGAWATLSAAAARGLHRESAAV